LKSIFPDRLLQSGLFLLLILFSVRPIIAAPANQDTCAVVDQLDYPIDGLVPGYDDFGLYRERFGGNHTGVDIGFDRWYGPVYASARGRVTYADPEGWDTEKGVVILQHTFPDNSIIYTVYGHMEETDTILFPQVGTCVERGTVIGAIGWPSRGRPHLHYEIRNFLPGDGGPGYVLDNPLDDGWYNPLDFTALWRARFTPAFLGYITSDEPSTLPPIQLESGANVIVSSDTVSIMLPPNQIVWRIKADSPIIGLAALPGDVVAIETQSGQISILQSGRYLAVWNAPTLTQPFLLLGDSMIFPTSDNGLAAYDTAGNMRWKRIGAGGNLLYLSLSGSQIGWATQTDSGIVWRDIRPDGNIAAEIPLTAFSNAYPLPDGSWLALSDTDIMYLQNGVAEPLAPLPAPVIQMTTDPAGNIYLYLKNSTLLSLDSSGATRWQTNYDSAAGNIPPLLAAGCVLYTLDDNALLHVFQSSDGTPLTTLQLYAGGRRTHSPAARLLRVDAAERLTISTGFLTTITLDGARLGNCS
jgi:murein DD-endopeptidase MepM/ murein hydrolase activator NlpD